MSLILQLAFNGLSMGAIYGLLALAIILIIKTADFVNFAQGDMIMVAAYAAIAVFASRGMGLSVAVAVAVAVLLGGPVFYFAVYRPLRKADQMTIIAATIGVDMLLRNLVTARFGANPESLPPQVRGNSSVGGAVINNQRILIICVAAVVLLAIVGLFQRTQLGRALRAVAQDRDIAASVGIAPGRSLLITLSLAAAMCAIAAALIAPVVAITPDVGWNLALYAFAGLIIGGWDSVPGSVVGGVIVGLVQAFLSYSVSAYLTDTILFSVVLAILLVRPKGIFGESIGVRA